MEETTKRAYEISYLLKSEEDVGVIVKLLSDLGAEIVNESAVSEIKLSYPIKKEIRACFGYLHFNLDTESVKKLNGALQLNSKVLRFLIITPPFVKTQSRRESYEERTKPVVEQRVDISNDALEEKLEEIKI
ncbi:MAG: hypothetical protein COX15_00295 [Candidatus Colwellbacteria bacterium CG23_combo_of_CG06-09_8_20_14_all_42_19]|uniref:Small ribosomal subunit protein bS6 n=1 Tax=Candidatus Colwellbacteria bacterium CG23_combo_of_CG06-09_8_20_14_all_42_19 TaxID=1974541 RepID=A0A2H0APL3_9BACT|nr:MAG: hypothetical protein COX15_00295 [Candidatus Colwellbacteria bacterium CG23_combo_of_CG06-09_8_20_14_all_42_19]